MTMPFVPASFKIPPKLETKQFRLRMLSISDVVKDYDAVMSSIEHLQGIFGPRSKWPSPELTFEQDLIDLGWHQKEFQKRSSFAYTMMSLDEQTCLGCMYIYPTERKGFDAEVFMWVRASAKELDAPLYQAVQKWLKKSWPFNKVAYPNRAHSF